MPYRQAQNEQEHQEYLIANPMSPEACKYRAQLWDSFFDREVEKIRQYDFQEFVTAHEEENGHSTSTKAPF